MNPFRPVSLILAILSFGTACGGSGGGGESDGDSGVDSGQSGGDAGNNSSNDAGSDAGPSGGDAGPGLTSASLVGTYTAHAPNSTPCFVTLFDHSVVQIAAVDADSVTISDGTATFACDIDGTSLDCDPVTGTVPAVQIGPSTYCEWPYTVTSVVFNVSPGGFGTMVQFATSPSPTTTTCMSTLGVCMGQATANFTRFVPTGAMPTPPPNAAVVKRTTNP